MYRFYNIQSVLLLILSILMMFQNGVDGQYYYHSDQEKCEWEDAYDDADGMWGQKSTGCTWYDQCPFGSGTGVGLQPCCICG